MEINIYLKWNLHGSIFHNNMKLETERTKTGSAGRPLTVA